MAKKNMEMYRGDSKTITVNFSKNASMVEDGTVWITLRKKKIDAECDENDPDTQCVYQKAATVEPVLDNGDIIGYKAELYMEPYRTEEFDITSYVYDIQVTNNILDSHNKPTMVKTLVEGKFKILEDVTIKV